MKKTAIAMIFASAVASPAFANSFVNGGFDDGNTNGWDVSNTAYRGNGTSNSDLTPAYILANQTSTMHSALISSGTLDPHLGNLLGSTVYSGGYSMRVEDTATGGYASVISQSVTNYTDANIFFAWKGVMLGAHGLEDAATMKLVLRDDTTNTDVITRTYNAAANPAGWQQSGSIYYTAAWQIEQLDVAALGLTGHNFTLSVLASDCEPTAHYGYVYLDGFGNVTPPTGVPEPGSLALLGLGMVGLLASYSRRRKIA